MGSTFSGSRLEGLLHSSQYQTTRSKWLFWYWNEVPCLVITADLFYTNTLLSRKMQLLWPRTIFSAITSDIPINFAQNSFCGAVIVWERQLLKLEICADAWEIVPAHCHQISLIIQFLSDFVGELLPDCVYGCLWTVPLYLQYQRGRWLAAK